MQHDFDISKKEEEENKSSAPIPPVPTKKRTFMEGLKKIGFNIWLVVMVIGGTLAFITSLFLV